MALIFASASCSPWNGTGTIDVMSYPLSPGLSRTFTKPSRPSGTGGRIESGRLTNQDDDRDALVGGLDVAVIPVGMGAADIREGRAG